MVCPRCGNEWDATKGACTRCGYVVRMAGQSGAFPNQSNLPQKNSHQSGGLSNPKQQSGGIPPVRRQSDGLMVPAQADFPATGRPAPMTPVPPQSSNYGIPNSPPFNGTFPKPPVENNGLSGVPQAVPQSGIPSTDPLSLKNGAQGYTPTYQANRSMGSSQQTIRRSQVPAQPQAPMGPNRSGSFNRKVPDQQMSRSANTFQQVPNTYSPVRSDAVKSGVQPLLPGVLLRGGRYRLQELQERQDWLPGVFEAVWIGKDAHRAGSTVMICEVILPENTQSILRTATMALATVGRHPHIPALWDAFSDQGRSFFVFEPIEGETLKTRIRYSRSAMPEQEVIECCLQLTDVLELLSQHSPQLVHGLIRPEHIVLSRNGSQYILTNFSIVLAGGATQYITGMERSQLTPYTAPEFIRGVADVRTDLYSLIATAYHALTGSAPAGISGSITQAQKINPNISSAFDAVLSKGLRSVPNQRYQRPSELRQDLLAMRRSVSGTIVPDNGNNALLQNNRASLVSNNGQRTDLPTQRSGDQIVQPLPIIMNSNDDVEEPVMLLPKPEDLPPMKSGNDNMNATVLLSLILVVLIVIVVLSHMMA